MPDTFDVSDETRFAQRRDELLDDFVAWAATHAPDADASDAGVALDWKFSYGDGDLTTWTVDELAEFALGWCPRKLSIAAGDAVPFLASVGSFFVFLAARGLLGERGAGPEQLRSWCARHTDRFAREMADPANFGMAKSLFAGVGGLEATPGGPEDVEALIRRLHELDPDQVDAILDGGDVDLPALGPVRRPDDVEVARSVASAPIVDLLGRLHEYCTAPGRTLTAKGNLRLADARELVGRLETGDVLDGVDRAVRSAEDLPELDWLLRTALRARVVRRHRGKLVAVAAWSRAEPVEAWERVVDAAIVEGLDNGGWGRAADDVAEALDDVTVQLWASLIAAHAAGTPVDLDALVDEVVADTARPVLDWLARSGARGVRHRLDRLERLGVLVQDGVTRGSDRLGLTEASGGTASLTPAGLTAGVRVLATVGVEVSGFPDPHAATATEMLDLVGAVSPEDWQREVDAWREAHDDAAAEFGRALADPDLDPEAVLGALALLEGVFAGEAVTVVEQIVGGRWDGVAVGWLADHGVTAYLDADPSRALPGAIELLALTLDHEGPEEMVAVLGNSPGEALDRMWRIDHPRTGDVLEVAGRRHPDKAVAKQARRSLAKYRSRAH